MQSFFWFSSLGDRLKIFLQDIFFFGEHLRLCPWSLALAASIPVLGLERVCPRKGCLLPWPWIFLCPRIHLWCLQADRPLEINKHDRHN